VARGAGGGTRAHATACGAPAAAGGGVRDLGAALRPDAAGFPYIDRANFHGVFAADLSADEARVVAATQRPVSGSVFKATIPAPAWKTIPSWCLMSQDDKAINPELERFYEADWRSHERDQRRATWAQHLPLTDAKRRTRTYRDKMQVPRLRLGTTAPYASEPRIEIQIEPRLLSRMNAASDVQSNQPVEHR